MPGFPLLAFDSARLAPGKSFWLHVAREKADSNFGHWCACFCGVGAGEFAFPKRKTPGNRAGKSWNRKLRHAFRFTRVCNSAWNSITHSGFAGFGTARSARFCSACACNSTWKPGTCRGFITTDNSTAEKNHTENHGNRFSAGRVNPHGSGCGFNGFGVQ